MKANSNFEVAKDTSYKIPRLTMSSFSDSEVSSIHDTEKVKAPRFLHHMAV